MTKSNANKPRENVTRERILMERQMLKTGIPGLFEPKKGTNWNGVKNTRQERCFRPWETMNMFFLRLKSGSTCAASKICTVFVWPYLYSCHCFDCCRYHSTLVFLERGPDSKQASKFYEYPERLQPSCAHVWRSVWKSSPKKGRSPLMQPIASSEHWSWKAAQLVEPALVWVMVGAFFPYRLLT